MTVSEILSWLSNAPQMQGEPLNLDFLPSYSGWSLSVMKSFVKTDILGNTVRSYTLKITRRHTVQNNTDRLAILSSLEDLAAWAKENPPPGSQFRVTDLPEFNSRNTSGIEDISIILALAET